MRSLRYDSYEDHLIWRRWNGETIRVCRDYGMGRPPVIDVAWIYAPGVEPSFRMDAADDTHFGAWTPLRYLGDPAPSNCWRVKDVLRYTSAEHPAPAFPDCSRTFIGMEWIEPPMSTIARGTTGWGDDE